MFKRKLDQGNSNRTEEYDEEGQRQLRWGTEVMALPKRKKVSTSDKIREARKERKKRLRQKTLGNYGFQGAIADTYDPELLLTLPDGALFEILKLLTLKEVTNFCSSSALAAEKCKSVFRHMDVFTDVRVSFELEEIVDETEIPTLIDIEDIVIRVKWQSFEELKEKLSAIDDVFPSYMNIGAFEWKDNCWSRFDFDYFDECEINYDDIFKPEEPVTDMFTGTYRKIFRYSENPYYNAGDSEYDDEDPDLGVFNVLDDYNRYIVWDVVADYENINLAQQLVLLLDSRRAAVVKGLQSIESKIGQNIPSQIKQKILNMSDLPTGNNNTGGLFF